MHVSSRVKMVSGAVAIVLVVAAVVWAVAPDRGAAQPSSPALYAVASSRGATKGGVVAQEPAPVGAGPIVILPEKVDLSPPLLDIPPIVPEKADETLIRFNEMGLPGSEEGGFDGVDHGLQDWQGAIDMPAPTQNWEGISNVSGVLPPDTQGDVGPNHFVQWVNLAFAVYNKTGTLLYGPANGSTLWTGFGGVCQTTNRGDPITLYDHLADRWFMSQFAFSTDGLGNPTCPCYQCIAVSQTPNPTGAWYRYAYAWPNNYMNDYPHFGLWPDGYYLTVNQFDASLNWAGAGVAAFERSRMLDGLSAWMIYFNLGTAYSGQLPADLEGITAPPSGAPNYILQWSDGTPNDRMRIWEFDADWATPSNSTLVLRYTLTTNNVDTDLCPAVRERCIDQPGTNVNLEAISDRLMYRVQYRNMGTHQAMVANHTVDTNSPAGRAGIHWFELRDSGSGWTIYQQGTYGPGDGLNRWMGSIAMDKDGNIALGYSVSGSSVYPGIRYVGRLANDPLNTLPQGETELQAGSGYQSHSAARWGDYSSLTMDISNGCTFWYTNEYIQTSGSAPWQTRIGSFSFPAGSCNPTAVELARFEGWSEGRAIHIEWETVTEIDNLGFNLYRADTADGPYAKLNGELIPSQAPGSPVGAVYVWLDNGVQTGQTYYYRLEDVDIYGYTTMHGPVRVKAGPTLRGKP
jgi:hypothetical protein